MVTSALLEQYQPVHHKAQSSPHLSSLCTLMTVGALTLGLIYMKYSGDIVIMDTLNTVGLLQTELDSFSL